MANVLGELFQDIADAIRSKTGNTATLKPNQFPSAIEGITTGGGGGSAEGCVTVTFMNGEVELFKRPVYIGDDCPEPVAQGRFDAPTKESTGQYNYTFYGWGASDGGAADANILKNITSDKTVYAIFTATARLYTITFYDEDGTTVLATKQFGYGTVPSYTPTKDGVTFGGWNPEPVPVTGNASYTVVWSSVLVSGTTGLGTSVAWELYTDGTLKIFGTGAMTDYKHQYGGGSGENYINSPLYPYASQITKVEIGDGITSVGGFYKFSNLVSVLLPASVTSIGNNAFNGCKSLTNIQLPDGLTQITINAFYGCSALPSINIPSSTTIIANMVFADCKTLTSITIPSSVTSIGKSAFIRCTGLTEAIFETPNGWSAGSTALSATDLADPATAATYLVTTYESSAWTRS